jgi:hypothetical protein
MEVSDDDLNSLFTKKPEPSAPSSQSSAAGASDIDSLFVNENKKKSEPSVAPVEPPMPELSDVAKGFAKNLIPSVGHAAYETVQPFLPANWAETGRNLKAAGSGLYNYASGLYDPKSISPEQKAQSDAMVNALKDVYARRYGSTAGFLTTLRDDPGVLLSDASMLFGIGELGTAGTVSKTLGTAARITDPLQLTGKAAGKLAEVGTNVASPFLSLSTGASGSSFRRAGEAGRMTSEEAAKIAEEAQKTAQGLSGASGTTSTIQNPKDAFYKHLVKGSEIADEALDATNDAIRLAAKQRSADYMAQKSQLGQAGTPIDMTHILDTVNQVEKSLYRPSGQRIHFGNDELYNTMGAIKNEISNTAALPNSARTLEEIDALKQGLASLRDRYRPGSQEYRIASEMQQSVWQTLANEKLGGDANYANMMKDYEAASRQLADYRSQLGSKTSDTTALKKILSAKGDTIKGSLIDDLAKYRPDLPHMIAGQDLSNLMPQGVQQRILDSIVLTGAGMANPSLLFGAPLASPKAMGMVNYGLNKPIDYIKQVPTVPAYAARQFEETERPEYGVYRTRHASGGKVDHASAEKISDMLVAAFARAKKDEELETKVLLNKPDEVIIDALKEAKKAI